MVFLLPNFSLSLLVPRYHCEAAALRLQWREKKQNPDSTRLDLTQNLGPSVLFVLQLFPGFRWSRPRRWSASRATNWASTPASGARSASAMTTFEGKVSSELIPIVQVEKPSRTSRMKFGSIGRASGYKSKEAGLNPTGLSVFLLNIPQKIGTPHKLAGSKNWV